MYEFVFTGLAFSCAGAFCALSGDLRKRTFLGLGCYIVVNGLIWTKFIFAVSMHDEFLMATSLFLFSQAVATCSYLAAVFFLDYANGTRPDVWLVSGE